ncbi:hypothetical protein EJ03DRAFT_328260 [Teratosphaeria nubilosa]|uniref:Uncharacterized protein n=1 Tax=Teratosphaeria nubilosa TaxID=161662 RepID=A0A6G1L647_9PEZI|nr:hypothetical protein EJ03DRAFT_328260 [Teratosphaeria nubilosa]
MADEEDTASPQGSGSTTYNFNLNFQAPHALSNLYSNATANQHYQPLSMQQGGVQYHGTVPHGDLHHPYQHQDTAVQAAFAQRTAPGGSQPQPGQHSIQGAPHPAPNQQRTAPGTAHYAASSRPPYSPTFQPHGRYSDIFKDGKVAILVSSTQQVQQDITDQGRTYDIQDYNQAGEFSQPTVPSRWAPSLDSRSKDLQRRSFS